MFIVFQIYNFFFFSRAGPQNETGIYCVQLYTSVWSLFTEKNMKTKIKNHQQTRRTFINANLLSSLKSKSFLLDMVRSRRCCWLCSKNDYGRPHNSIWKRLSPIIIIVVFDGATGDVALPRETNGKRKRDLIHIHRLRANCRPTDRPAWRDTKHADEGLSSPYHAAACPGKLYFGCRGGGGRAKHFKSLR